MPSAAAVLTLSEKPSLTAIPVDSLSTGMQPPDGELLAQIAVTPEESTQDTMSPSPMTQQGNWLRRQLLAAQSELTDDDASLRHSNGMQPSHHEIAVSHDEAEASASGEQGSHDRFTASTRVLSSISSNMDGVMQIIDSIRARPIQEEAADSLPPIDLRWV